jgi:hypothetical protein
LPGGRVNVVGVCGTDGSRHPNLKTLRARNSPKTFESRLNLFLLLDILWIDPEKLRNFVEMSGVEPSAS